MTVGQLSGRDAVPNAELVDVPTGEPPVGHLCIHQIFERQVARTGYLRAVVWGKDRLTYAELDRRANQLAHHLRGLGARPEKVVGVWAGRSPSVAVAILGVLKSGAAYLPLDPTCPKERLAYMLDDTGAEIVVTLGRDSAAHWVWPGQYDVVAHGILDAEILELAGHRELEVVDLDDDVYTIARNPGTPPDTGVMPGNLAYVIYTSGSTGRPKGVMVPHRATVNHNLSVGSVYGLAPGESVLQFASLGFDVSIEEIFATWLSGATLVLRPELTPPTPRELEQLVDEHSIRILNLPAGYWQVWMQDLVRRDAPLPSPLRLVVAGSDRVAPEDLELWRRHVGGSVRWLNAYGVTEAAVTSMVYDPELEGEPGETVPIGRPIAGVRAYVLDEEMREVETGSAGELYVGGTSVARGYVGRPDLTSEKFVPDPFSENPEEVLYRTGDMARRRADGNFEFLGRIDGQVKLRGFRIELGEIETVMRRQSGVEAVTVMLREDRPGEKRLVAYVVGHAWVKDTTALRQALRTTLPEYMVPSAIVVLDELPMNVNGKVDKTALPPPRERAGGETEEPQTAGEAAVAAVFAEVVGHDRIGRNDDFFELGGDSLGAIRAAARLSERFGTDVAVQALIDYPSVAKLASALEEGTLKSVRLESRETVRGGEDSALLPERRSGRVRRERRSLRPLFESGELPPVDGVALDYLSTFLLRQTRFSRADLLDGWCQGRPLIHGVVDTSIGCLATAILPIFEDRLFTHRQETVDRIVEGLHLAAKMGARVVSLTGLLPSATSLGRDVAAATAGIRGLPRITTGHETTAAAVVLTIQRAADETGRRIEEEHVGFLGLGSIGQAALRLLLLRARHPAAISLSDVFGKREELDRLSGELRDEYGFRGPVYIQPSRTDLPAEFYEAGVIVGATNAANVLDVESLRPGTIVVDDSWPHCLDTEAAMRRMAERQDILAAEAGALRFSTPFEETVYAPPAFESGTEAFDSAFGRAGDPYELMGCELSSVLTATVQGAPETIGPVQLAHCVRQYDVLTGLGLRSASLYLDDRLLSPSLIELFWVRYGRPYLAAR